MSVIPADRIRESFELIRQHSHPLVHELVNTLEQRMLRDEALLAMQERVDGAVEQLFAQDPWSRRVPDVPALRLVGAFGCDPDESCGQAS